MSCVVGFFSWWLRHGYWHACITQGGSNELIIGGSEDGCVYLWDLNSGECLSQLAGHAGVVYHTTWSRHRSLLASCSDDGTAMTWWYDELKPALST